MVLDPTRPETAFILTGAVPAAGSAAATAMETPSYCREIAAVGRVYTLPLRISEQQAAWASARGQGGRKGWRGRQRRRLWLAYSPMAGGADKALHRKGRKRPRRRHLRRHDVYRRRVNRQNAQAA